jgi:glycogen debranching enzyme
VERFAALRKLSEQSLRANLIPTAHGTLCVAGAHQFKTLWTRDFCYAVPGLLKIGAEDLVRRQLDLILTKANSDGLLPRGLDVVSPKVRVINSLLRDPLSRTGLLNYGQPLRAEYKGEHRTIAFDSNVLWLRAALQYCASTGDQAWLVSRRSMVDELMKFYARTRGVDGLWVQPAFSDWMDSLRRTGPQLAFHVLLLRAVREYEAFGVRGAIESEALLRVIRQTWFDESAKWKEQSTDALLFSLEAGLGDSALLFAEIRRRPVGVPATPQPKSEASWTARLVGLRHYHDGIAWSWLAAETARVVRAYDASYADEILTDLQLLVEHEHTVPEIYMSESNSMVRLPLYTSERPFTWGAGKIIEAL